MAVQTSGLGLGQLLLALDRTMVTLVEAPRGLDMPVGSVQQWQPLVDTTGDAAAFDKRYGAATQQRVIPRRPHKVARCMFDP